jgi:hypothetical protein
MVSSELTLPRPACVGRSSLPVVALATWVAAVIGIAVVAIAIATTPDGRLVAHALLGANPRIAPHAASGRTLGYAFGLLVNNAIVALWPLTGLFLLHDFPRSWRRVFIAVVVLAAVRSVVPVAAALGLWGTRLLPYIPNAPFELAAITTGAVLYVLRSDQRISPRSLGTGVVAVGLLLAIAAVLETWAVPAR